MPDYQIDVGVEPDASRFPEQLAAAVGKAEARQDPLEVQLTPKVGREFARDAKRELKTALAQLDAQVALSPTLAKSFRRDVQRLAKEATKGQGIEVPISPVLGKGFRRDLQKSIKTALTGVEPEVPVQAKLGPGFRAKLQRSVNEGLATRPLTAAVDLTVSAKGYASFVKDVNASVRDATRLASETGASDVRLGIDSTGFAAEVIAEVGAATTAASATEAGSVEIRADTGAAQAEIAAVGAEATGSSGLMSKFSTAAVLGLAGITAAAGVTAYALFSIGSSFDDAYDSIVVTTGATGDKLAGLQQSFRNVAATVPSDFEDISTAVGGVNQRLGLTGPVLDTVSGQLLDLSRITGTDLTTNLTGAAGALQSFQVPAEAIPAALDAVFRASQASGVAVGDLTSSLEGSGAALRTAGFSFEESTALLAQLQRAGVPAEQVIGSLSIAARKLAKDGKDPAVAIGDLVTQIKEAKSPTEALATAQAVFGRGAVGITDAIRSGKFELGDFLKTVEGGKSTIAGTAAETADAAESFQLLKNNLKLALETPASLFFSQISKVVTSLTPVIRQLGPVLTEIVGALGGLARGFLVALIPVIQKLLPAVAPIVASLGKAFTSLAPVLPPLVEALGSILTAAAPLLPVFAQLIAIVAKTLVPVITGLADALGPVISLLADQLGDVLVSLAPIVVQLGTAFGDLLAQIGPVLVDVIGSIAKELAPILPDLADAGLQMALAFSDLLVALLPLIPPLIKLSTRFFTKPNILLITLAARALAVMAEAIAPLVASVAKFIASGADKLLDFTSGLADLNADKIQEGLGNIASAIGSGLAAAGQAVLDFITDIPNELGKIPGLIGEAILGLVPTLIGALGGLLLAVGTWFVTEAVPGIAAKATELAGAFLGWIAETIVTLPIELAKILAYIILWVGITAVQLGIKAHELAVSFFGWITQTLADLPGKLASVALSIIGWIVSTAPTVAAEALKLASSFLGWVAQVVTDLPGKLLEVAGSIAKFLTDLPGNLVKLITTLGPKLAEVGLGLVKGMFSGLIDAGASALGFAKDIVNGVIGFINDHVIDAINKALKFDFKVKGIGISVDAPDIPHLPELAKGGLITTPTLALVGEAGPELVLPLTDKSRLVELLTQAGVLGADGGLSGAIPGSTVPSAAAGPGAGDPAAAGAGLGWTADTDSLQAWVDASVALLSGLGQQIADGSLPPLRTWRDQVAGIFTELETGQQAWADRTVAVLAAWAGLRVPAATIPALGVWQLAVADVSNRAGDGMAAGLQHGVDASVLIAAAGGTRIVDALVTSLSGGTVKVAGVAATYARKLAAGVDPILKAVGAQPVKFATGGHVPGPAVNRDVVPAMLTPGEVVIRRASVQQFGVDNLLALNAGQLPPGWFAPRGYAEGGTVTGDTQGLNGEFVNRLGLWSGAVGQAYNVTSGYRSIAEQARLYQAYLAGTGNLAAPPGASMHNFGLASDGPHWGRFHPEAFGLRFAVPGEPWHVEPNEARQWAHGGAPDGTSSGAAGVLAGLAPLPKPPAMPFEGAVASVATSVLQYAYEKALAWAGAQTLGGTGPSLAAGSLPVNVQRILATIRAVESGGDYNADNPTSSAFGAYQFLASTYASLAKRFGFSATDHSRTAQDSIAGRYVQEILGMNHGDLRSVPATWYVGSYNPADLNYTPKGNTISVADYLTKWLAKYGSIEGFENGGLVTSDGLYRMAERNRPELVLPLTRPDRVRQLAQEHALDEILYGDRSGGGSGAGPTIEGDVIVQVTPPGADDPENYGMAISHRLVPAIASALARL